MKASALVAVGALRLSTSRPTLVAIRTDPPGATVKISDQSAARTPLNRPLSRLERFL